MLRRLHITAAVAVVVHRLLALMELQLLAAMVETEQHHLFPAVQ